MMKKLLDCPFCGGEAEYTFTDLSHTVRCLTCRTYIDRSREGWDCDSWCGDDCIKAWNTRKTGEWQPIETAPRDGSQIVIYGKKLISTNNICGWHKDEYIEIVIGWWEGSEWNSGYCDEGSADTEGYTFALMIALQPTHWTPLQEPPEDEVSANEP